jgi:hypothetical protein
MFVPYRYTRTRKDAQQEQHTLLLSVCVCVKIRVMRVLSCCQRGFMFVVFLMPSEHSNSFETIWVPSIRRACDALGSRNKDRMSNHAYMCNELGVFYPI